MSDRAQFGMGDWADIEENRRPAASYAVYIEVLAERPTANGCRYATREEARRAGEELLSRWTLPKGFEVRPTEDPVNYEFTTGPRPRPIESAPPAR